MKTSFWIGLSVGIASGACIVSGNNKLRELVEKGKQKIEEKIDDTL